MHFERVPPLATSRRNHYFWELKLNPMPSLPIKNVVAAIIRRGDRIFATQRGYGEWKDWWEFPGGKIEEGETPEQALMREIAEELSAQIRIERLLHILEYDYPNFHLRMHCFLCSLASDEVTLNEHEAARWLAAQELNSVRWLPADDGLLPIIARELKGPAAAFETPAET